MASQGADLIVAERKRQIEAEGWNDFHDDRYSRYELINAAVCYALKATEEGSSSDNEAPYSDNGPWAFEWPWDYEWWKPSLGPDGVVRKEDAIRMLEKAGALLAAEIDRLLRKTE